MNKQQLEEMQEIYRLSAFYVDKVYITGLGPVVRLSFTENINGVDNPMVRTAVVMNVDCLTSLRNMLNQILEQPKPIETSVETPKEPTQDAPPILQ